MQAFSHLREWILETQYMSGSTANQKLEPKYHGELDRTRYKARIKDCNFKLDDNLVAATTGFALWSCPRFQYVPETFESFFGAIPRSSVVRITLTPSLMGSSVTGVTGLLGCQT